MTTRFNAKDLTNRGVPGVPSGYDGINSDFSIPSCGLEDVDVAMFELFDKEISPAVGGQDSSDMKKVPIVFAAGEKWALLKKGKPIRDKNNSLILPLITISRTSAVQDSNDITGRGINQQTGELVVQRRLDASDRNFQKLVNRFLVKNQQNISVDALTSVDTLPSTLRKTGELADKSWASDSTPAPLLTNRKGNIYETIVVPAPQFYTSTFEVTIWTQYMQHMNQIIEKLMSSFLPQAQSWKLTTSKGYWFVATVEPGSYSFESNFDDMSSAERYIKQKITVKVPAYIWASSAPGVPVPVKRYVSSPIIQFSVAGYDNVTESGYEETTDSYMLGNDDPTLPIDERPNNRPDQRTPGWRQQKVYPGAGREQVDSNDPALSTFPRGFGPGAYKKIEEDGIVKYVRIVNVNAASGETVYAASDLDALKIIVTDK